MERNAVSQIDDLTFNLAEDAHYLLLASGKELRNNSISYHDIVRESSALPILFDEENPIIIAPKEHETPSDSNFYDECQKTKSCFGSPRGCVDDRNCNFVGAVIVKNGIYQFEMLSFNKAHFD